MILNVQYCLQAHSISKAPSVRLMLRTEVQSATFTVAESVHENKLVQMSILSISEELITGPLMAQILEIPLLKRRF